jgi:rhodanese-related sulfurtransferase
LADGMIEEELVNRINAGEVVLLDVRPGVAYTKGHVARAVSAPFSRMGWGRAVKNWLGPDFREDLVILADNPVVADAAAKALAAEGITPRAVWHGGPSAWQAMGMTLVAVQDVTADELARQLPEWTVVDVREPYEWRSGIIPGAITLPMNQLPERLAELDPGRRYAIVCASGNRSQAAAAFLADRGYVVSNVVGGMSMWLAGRHPVDYPGR